MESVDLFANILKGYLQTANNENGNREDCLVLESDEGMVGVQIDAPAPAIKVFRRAMYRTRHIVMKVAMAFMDRHVNRWARRFARLAGRGTAPRPSVPWSCSSRNRRMTAIRYPFHRMRTNSV